MFTDKGANHARHPVLSRLDGCPGENQVADALWKAQSTSLAASAALWPVLSKSHAASSSMPAFRGNASCIAVSLQVQRSDLQQSLAIRRRGASQGYSDDKLCCGIQVQIPSAQNRVPAGMTVRGRCWGRCSRQAPELMLSQPWPCCRGT